MTSIVVEGSVVHLGPEVHVCPFCGHDQEPKEIGQNLDGEKETQKLHLRTLEAVLRCGHSRCGRVFISRYKPSNARYVFEEIIPPKVETPSVPEAVATLSERFVSAYEQAAKAEAFGLLEICGMGYRKALEFLIKDYCIEEKPGEAEAIRNVQLGPCIENYVDDARVKQCAKLTAWLGNDESHYERRWADKDLKDLKALLGVTISWIDNDLISKKHVADMIGAAPPS